jgi:hypothetical protein
MRAAFLVPAGLIAVVCGCSSSGDDEPRAQQTTTPATTTAAQPPQGGALDALVELVQAADTSRCFQDVGEAAPPTSGGKTTAAIARDVERLRGLRFDELPQPRYLTSRAVDRRVARWLEEYPDAEASADGRTLVALGALPAGSDLEALLRRALAGQVAGFYDPRNEELVVESGADRALDALGRVVLAHELEHALVDQALGLPESVAAGEPAEGDEDAALAATALVEGDATVVMEAYALEHLSLLDAIRAIGPALASERDLAALPYYLQASMLFPYEEGLRFVCELHERGGVRSTGRTGSSRRRPRRSCSRSATAGACGPLTRPTRRRPVARGSASTGRPSAPPSCSGSSKRRAATRTARSARRGSGLARGRAASCTRGPRATGRRSRSGSWAAPPTIRSAAPSSCGERPLASTRSCAARDARSASASPPTRAQRRG